MKLLLTSLAALSILLPPSQSFAAEQKLSAWQLQRQRFELVLHTKPRRLDEPLREDNISDNEVREIQAITDREFPGQLVNISGVTAGCPCEDGAGCDSQVWVVAHRDGRSGGLLLSRIDEVWAIGPVQLWWREYERQSRLIAEVLAARKPDRWEQYRMLQERQNKLLENFPLCSAFVAQD